MKLDTLEQRHKLIENMVEKGFDFEESLINDKESGDDWAGAMNTVENLIVVEEMIRTEQIFRISFSEMEEIRSRNVDEKELYLNIVDDALTHFIDTVLLRRLEFAFDQLNGWDFKSAEGKKFKKNYCKKLDELIKKYQDIYDL
ncbi:MAG: hypothetical protein IKZ53_09025 [Selenomonadaceae bacterium]|nr:hypothetical protein [Selenomonadaceae bacterium]